MPHSYGRVIVHLVFSTKNRATSIADGIRPGLHAQIVAILSVVGCVSMQTNSVSDHVHIIFLLSRQHALSDIAEEVKRLSSRWVKEQGEEHAGFCWQTGYAAFSVGEDALPRAVEYVRNQREHHRGTTFEEEMKAMSARHR